MVQLDLTQEAKKAPLDLGVLPELDERERIIVEGTWRGRMVNEHASARVFADLVGQAMRAGMPAATAHELAEMASEELKHARMCAGVLYALGGSPIGELRDVSRIPEHADAEPLEAFLRNVISVSCLSETTAVALISAERIDLHGSKIGEVLERILADEVRHSRFGWKLLDQVGLSEKPELCARLDAYLPLALEHLIEHELAHLSPVPAPTARAACAGVCDGTNARAIFAETLEAVIIPGLTRRGLTAPKAPLEAIVSRDKLP